MNSEKVIDDKYFKPNDDEKIIYKTAVKKKGSKIFSMQNAILFEQSEIIQDDIWGMIEKMQLQEQFSKEMAADIFKEIDTDNLGKIPTERFIDHIMKQSKKKSTYGKFYELADSLISNSEKIIGKLKKLKKKCYIHNDTESVTDINWIIEVLCDSALFEMEYSPLARRRSNSHDYMGEAIDIISQYSNLWDQNRKINDIMKTQAQQDKSFTTSFKKIPSQMMSDMQSLRKEALDDSFVLDEHDCSQLDSSDLPSCTSEENNINIPRRRSSITSLETYAKAMQCIEKIDTCDFNIFELNELIDKNTIYFMTHEVFIRLDFYNVIFKEKQFKNFMKGIKDGYNRNVPYHNDLHAGDVFQTSFFMIANSSIEISLNLKNLDMFSLLLAAVCHDFKHPGRNNMYHINARTDFALTYNDCSVLENYHVSEVFKLMKEDCNILHLLSPEEYRIVRRRMIESILATDMALHAKTLNNLKTKLETFEVDDGKNLEKMIFSENIHKTYENQQAVLNMILHTADISNPGKPAAINKIWVDLVFIEYFSQGDTEKNESLPISSLCDRTITDVSKSQIGFINIIVRPTFETLMRVIPEVSQYYAIMNDNQKRYEEIVNMTSTDV